MSDKFELHLDRIEHYKFQTNFGSKDYATVVLDEPPPLGEGAGPNPTRLLAAAVANCLSSSLIFCLSRSHVELGGVTTTVVGSYVRNERNRLRIGQLDVRIELDLQGNDPASLRKCLDMYEDFCVVTASVRKGLPVTVTIVDTDGNVL